jgi:hypothetical protein
MADLIIMQNQASIEDGDDIYYWPNGKRTRQVPDEVGKKAILTKDGVCDGLAAVRLTSM